MSAQRSRIASFEQAVIIVRLVLAFFGAVVVVGDGLGSASHELAPTLALSGALVIGAVAHSTLSLIADRRGWWRGRRALVVVQIVDTVVAVGVVCLLAGPVPLAAWVLMVLPMVMASIRFDEIGVAGTWVLAAFTYAVCVRSLPIRFGFDLDMWLEQVGMLLGVAGALALLARWLKDQWLLQATLTEAAFDRTERLKLVGIAARAMRGVDIDDVLVCAVGHVPALGFDAATRARGGALLDAVGATNELPNDTASELDPRGVIEMTRWMGPAGAVIHSVSVREPTTGDVVTGWRTSVIDDDSATALADLVEHATQALEAATYLESARREAATDPLTGLSNRSEFQRRLDAASLDPGPAAIIFIDIDHFKSVNDEHGHLAGDGVLLTIAERLRSVASDEIVPARFGGDEFIVLVTGSAADANVHLAERIRRVLAQAHDVNDTEVYCTASIGVASKAAVGVDHLLSAADGAAYEAKKHGRNRVWVCRQAPRDDSPPPIRVSGNNHRVGRRSTDQVVTTGHPSISEQPSLR